MAAGGVGGQLSPGTVPGGVLTPGFIPGGAVTIPPQRSAIIGTPAGTVNFGAFGVPPTTVIVTGGASKTVPGGMINGNGVGGTSGVIVTGGALSLIHI